MVRLKRNYTDTSQFDNGLLPYGKAFATSLLWLYDYREFKNVDDQNSSYRMRDMRLYDLMSIVTDIIYLAFMDFGEYNIGDYIARIESYFMAELGFDPIRVVYKGKFMDVEIEPYTTNVILWSAYVYCDFRRKLEPKNKKAERAASTLYKLYSNRFNVKPEEVKDTFLMKHFNKTMAVFLENIPTDKELKSENTSSHAMTAETESKMESLLKEKDEEIQKLNEEILKLNEELAVYQQEPITDNPHDKVRLEVFCKLLEKSGVEFEKYGTKAEAARLAEYITGVAPSTCGNYMTNRDLNTTVHSEEVLRVNTQIKKIGIEWQL